MEQRNKGTKTQRHKDTKTIIVLCLLFICLLPAWSSDYKSQLQKVDKDIEVTQKEKDRLEDEGKNILDELAKVDRDISESRKTIRRLREEEERIEKILDTLVITIGETEEQAKNKQGVAKNKMLILYQNTLSSPASTPEGEQNQFYFQEIIKKDIHQYKEYRLTSDTLSSREKEERRNFLALMETRRQKELEQAKILEKRNAKKQMLENIKNATEEKEQLIKELKESRANLEKLIKGVKKVPVVAETFKNMAWPVLGKQARLGIVSKFGTVIDPELGTTLLNNGIDISADYDTPVLAVGSGEVAYEGVFLGYGKIVLIDHQNGFSTLYAHLSETLVTKGEKIDKNEVIGKVGATGLTDEPVLHFEIRKNGKAVDPLMYLP